MRIQRKVWLRPGVIFWKKNDKYYIQDIFASQFFQINSTCYRMLEMCNGQHKVADIIEYMSLEYNTSKKILQKDVWNVLSQLDDLNLVRFNHPKHLFTNEIIEHDGKEKVKTVIISYTDKCNLKCLFCYAHSGKKLPNELSTEKWKSVIDKIFNFCDPKVILFTGGEPLARKGFLEVAEYAKNRGGNIVLFTNGTLIDGNNATEIADVGFDYVSVSIDGANGETHDRIRGVRNSYKKALKGLDLLIELGVNTAWQTTVCSLNYGELEQMLLKAVDMGVKKFRCGSVDCLGRAYRRYSKLMLKPEEEVELMMFLKKSSVKYNGRIEIGFLNDTEAFPSVESVYPTGVNLWKSISLGSGSDQKELKVSPQFLTNSVCDITSMIHITPEGYVTPCPSLVSKEFIGGHILRDSLKKLWNNARVLRLFRNKELEEFDKCGSCGFRYLCRGGCRANAYYMTNSIYGCDLKRFYLYKHYYEKRIIK